MLRAAAKNFAHVAPVCRPEQYERVLDELRERRRALADDTRRALAAEAFATTAAYEAAIARWFGEREPFPPTLTLAFEKVHDLSYGENPHQRAAYYSERGARRHVLSMVEQLGGKQLSFNNLNDLSAARLLVREFALPACVIVKHANPCGVALAGTVERGVRAARSRAIRRPRTAASSCSTGRSAPSSAARLAEQFVEVLLAPGYDDEALARLREKPGHADPRRRRAARLRPRRARLQARARRPARPGPRLGGRGPRGHGGRRAATPTEADWGDLLFAWRVCKHVASNAIVLAKGLRTIGIGAGQMSRVDAVRIAIEKAREHGHDARRRGARLRRVLPVRRRPAGSRSTRA